MSLAARKFLLSPIPGGTNRRILTGILLLGTLLRIYIAFFTSLPNMHRDSYYYFRQADILLMGDYSNFFPNGYPIIIAFVKLITVTHTIGILLWLNIFLSAFTIFFVYDLAVKMFGNYSFGLFAALILAVFPSQLNCVRWLTTEVPSAFFLLAAYVFYYRKRYFICGLLFGIASVIRTNIAPIFILLLVMEFVWQKKINVKVLLGGMLPLLLVASYCYWRTGQFSVSGNSEINVLYAVTASGGYVDYYMGDKYPQINTMGKAIKMYVDHMKESPGEFLRQRWANLWELWGCPSAANGGRGMSSRIILLTGNLFMVLLGLAGWWKNRAVFDRSILILPFVVITLLHTFLIAIPRYTYPAEAFMILLASWKLWQFFQVPAPTATHPGSIHPDKSV